MDEREVTPRPVEVAHAILEEINHTRSDNSRTLRWLAPAVSVIVGFGVLIGVLGGAFFVKREEYNASEQGNAVAHAKIGETLAHIDQALQAQTQAIGEMSRALHAQAVELATLRNQQK